MSEFCTINEYKRGLLGGGMRTTTLSLILTLSSFMLMATETDNTS